MKKVIAVLLAVMLMVGVLAGCGGTSTETPGGNGPATGGDPSGKTIAVCMGSMNHPVHRVVQMAFLTTGDDMGYNAIIGGLDEGSTQELQTKFESIIANGAEGVLLWASDDTYYQFMRDMSEMCYFVVPHFAHEYADTKNFISRNIVAQAKEYGYAAGEFLLEQLAKKGITSGVLGNTQAGPNVTENAASDAFRNAIAESGTNFTVADVVFEGLELSEASVKVVGVINSNPGIVGGFGTTGGSCQSWALAMEQTGKTNLVVVGVDYTEYNIDLVSDGTIAGIVAQPLYDEAAESVRTLDKLFRGEVFNDTAENWWLKMDAPVAYVGGEGNADIEYYRPIIEEVIEYYSE
jgi:ribose transport system substrate-binding protein